MRALALILREELTFSPAPFLRLRSHTLAAMVLPEHRLREGGWKQTHDHLAHNLLIHAHSLLIIACCQVQTTA